MIATSAETATVCPFGICSTKDITNVIAAATAAIGIHILTAVDVYHHVATFSWDDTADVDFLNLSVRKIQPS
jgi:hypothetical protein